MFSQVVILTFELLTSKPNQFIFVPKCTKDVNLMKFPSVVHEIKLSGCMHTQMDNQPRNIMPAATNDG